MLADKALDSILKTIEDLMDDTILPILNDKLMTVTLGVTS